MAQRTIRKRKRTVANSKTDRAPGRPRDPATDDAILRAAADLFMDQGIEGANIEQIAKRTGVARATIYRRWRNKEELLAQAVFKLGKKAPEFGVESLEQLSAEELSLFLLEGFTNTLMSPDFRRLAFRLLGAIPSHPALLSVYWNTYVLPWRRAITRALERTRKAGVLPKSTDVDVLMEMLSGAVTNRMLLPGNKTNLDEIRAWVRRLLCQSGLIGSRK